MTDRERYIQIAYYDQLEPVLEAARRDLSIGDFNSLCSRLIIEIAEWIV